MKEHHFNVQLDSCIALRDGYCKHEHNQLDTSHEGIECSVVGHFRLKTTIHDQAGFLSSNLTAGISFDLEDDS